MPRVSLRSALSVVLAIATAMLFSLNPISMAAQSEPDGGASKTSLYKQELVRSQSAILISSGPVFLDGNLAQSGTTIFSDSAISTSSDSSALIELGQFGRFELGPSTAVRVILTPTSASISSASGEIRVVVTAGTLEVSSTEVKGELAKGETAVIKSPMSATLESDGVVSVSAVTSTVDGRTPTAISPLDEWQDSVQNPSDTQSPTDPQNQQDPQNQNKKSRGLPWWAWAAFGGVLAGIGGGVAASQGGHHQQPPAPPPVSGFTF